MDIGQFIFPFIMAVITNSIMIVAIYFLRKIPYFANLFSVWFMVILYLVCILRMFLPLEFPSVQIVMMDDTVYPAVVDFFAVRASSSSMVPRMSLYIVLCIWLAGMIIFAIIAVVRQMRFRNYVIPNSYSATETETQLFTFISNEILGAKNIILRKTDVISGAIVTGLFKKVVFIPDREYDSAELEMIFRHECIHIKNKDLWIKLLVQIYCCIFWWNPVAYLLKRDLDFSLEMKCDLSLVEGFSSERVLVYLSALRDNAKCKKPNGKPFVICAELANSVKGKELVKRMKAIISDPPNRPRQVAVNTVVTLLFVAVFTASYLFIWQPFYGFDIENDDYTLADDGIIVDETNSYLVPQDDGSYLFYFSNLPPIPVTKEEFDQGLYEGYPICDK